MKTFLLCSDDQNGFRAGRSTITNIEYFNEKFYAAFEEGRFYDILFIDFMKAFDSISHAAIFQLLEAIGLPEGHLNLIKALFHDAHCFTNFKSGSPARIDFHSGVKQGQRCLF